MVLLEARPKLSWLLSICNHYRKSGLNRPLKKIVGNANLHFYSGHRWILKASESVSWFFQYKKKHFSEKNKTQARIPVQLLYNSVSSPPGIPGTWFAWILDIWSICRLYKDCEAVGREGHVWCGRDIWKGTQGLSMLTWRTACLLCRRLILLY